MYHSVHKNILSSTTVFKIANKSIKSAFVVACSISSSFQNSLKTSGIEVMSFWSFRGIWSCLNYRFPAAEEFVVVFDIFFVY